MCVLQCWRGSEEVVTLNDLRDSCATARPAGGKEANHSGDKEQASLPVTAQV